MKKIKYYREEVRTDNLVFEIDIDEWLVSKFIADFNYGKDVSVEQFFDMFIKRENKEKLTDGQHRVLNDFDDFIWNYSEEEGHTWGEMIDSYTDVQEYKVEDDEEDE